MADQYQGHQYKRFYNPSDLAEITVQQVHDAAENPKKGDEISAANRYIDVTDQEGLQRKRVKIPPLQQDEQDYLTLARAEGELDLNALLYSAPELADVDTCENGENRQIDFFPEIYESNTGQEFLDGLLTKTDTVDEHGTRIARYPENLIEDIIGPIPSFTNQMYVAQCKFQNSKDYYLMEGFAPIIENIADISGQIAMWLMRYIMKGLPAQTQGRKSFKVMISMSCVFYHIMSDGQIEYRKFIFDEVGENPDGAPILVRTGSAIYKTAFNTAVKMIDSKMNVQNLTKMSDVDSKCEFHSVKMLTVSVFGYTPLQAGSFIALPENLRRSRCIVNPKTETNCFKYAVIIALVRKKVTTEEWKTIKPNIYHAFLSSWQRKYDLEWLNFDGVEGDVPIEISFFNTFAKNNPRLGFSIWEVVGDGKFKGHPIQTIYQSFQVDEHKEFLIDLLVLTSIENRASNVNTHFCAITNLDGLFFNSSGHHKVHVCPYCKLRFNAKSKTKMGCCPVHERDLLEAKKREKVGLIAPNVSLMCRKCNTFFANKQQLLEHDKVCLIKDKNYRIISLPQVREYLEPKTSERMKQIPLHTFMVSDFESILVKEDRIANKQYFLSKHKPCSFSLLMHSDYPELCRFLVYTGKSTEDTIEKFCETILQWSTDVYNYYRQNVKMNPLTREQFEYHESATNCYLCGREFLDIPGRIKQRDHDHMTGEYLGPACGGCNVNRRPERDILPLFFHNGKNYDTHLLINEITKAKYNCHFDGIPMNSQKFMTLTIKRFDTRTDSMEIEESKRNMQDIVILDSLLFLLSSLEKLVETQKAGSRYNGRNDEEKLQGYRDVFPLTYDYMMNRYCGIPLDFVTPIEFKPYASAFTLALRKNSYPYLWFDSFEKFDLPIDALTDLFDHRRYEFFTDNPTESFKVMFEDKIKIYHEILAQFGFKTVKEYAELYVGMDTLQLADILQNTRKTYMKVHKLDMYKFVGLPGYTWAAFMNHIADNRNKPQLFMEGEMDMICFFARAIRGGCAGVMKRYSHANYPGMEGYDPTQPEKHLIYLDANNLYGWSMSQYLPVGNFKWADSELIRSCNTNPALVLELYLEKLPVGRGAFLEVDLDYPMELHNRHNYYPLAPVKRSVSEDEISEYSKLLNEYSSSKHDSVNAMLLQTLEPRRNYITYYKNLIFYLKHGLVLKKVHKIIEFDEYPIMRSYIELNTMHRNQSKTAAEKITWKTLNNAAYGKTFENQLNYSALKFISTDTSYERTVAKPGFDGYVFFNDNLMIAKLLHEKINFNKPIYLGATITELAKLHMYEFYYDKVQPFFGWENVKLCMTDTDSLLLEITCKDFYQKLKQFQEEFDYPIDTNGFRDLIGKHNGEVGYFKSETGDTPITEFVGLRAKVYSFLTQDNPEATMKAKGVGKAAMEMSIEHKSYLRCIFNNYDPTAIRQLVSVPMIRSFGHELYSMISDKIGLSCNDTKRYILRDNVHTLAFGHWAIKHYKNNEYPQIETLPWDEEDPDVSAMELAAAVPMMQTNLWDCSMFENDGSDFPQGDYTIEELAEMEKQREESDSRSYPPNEIFGDDSVI